MKNTFKIKELSVGEFFRISFLKIVFSVIISLALALLFLLYLPISRNLFLSESITKQIVDVAVNTIVYMIVLYPYTCWFRYLVWRKR
jgi:hypothetical protein